MEKYCRSSWRQDYWLRETCDCCTCDNQTDSVKHHAIFLARSPGWPGRVRFIRRQSGNLEKLLRQLSRHTMSRNLLILLFSSTIALALLTINIETLVSTDIIPWMKILTSSLLVVCFVSGVFSIKFLRPMGWLGVSMFFLCVIAISMPGEDYTFGGSDNSLDPAPHFVNWAYLLLRFVIFSGILISLMWTFSRIRNINSNNS